MQACLRDMSKRLRTRVSLVDDEYTACLPVAVHELEYIERFWLSELKANVGDSDLSTQNGKVLVSATTQSDADLALSIIKVKLCSLVKTHGTVAAPTPKLQGATIDRQLKEALNSFRCVLLRFRVAVW